jgi:hypothetical protein
MRRLIPFAVLALAASGCSSSVGPAASVSTPPAATSPAPDPTAPAPSECTDFAQVYNTKVSPVLKGTGATGDVYLTEMTDAFNTLAAALTGPDPYSETVRKDALALAADPSSYEALVAFNTDLPQYLTQCGMSAGTAAP